MAENNNQNQSGGQKPKTIAPPKDIEELLKDLPKIDISDVSFQKEPQKESDLEKTESKEPPKPLSPPSPSSDKKPPVFVQKPSQAKPPSVKSDSDKKSDLDVGKLEAAKKESVSKPPTPPSVSPPTPPSVSPPTPPSVSPVPKIPPSIKAPVKAKPLEKTPVKEPKAGFKSHIRTMASDIKSIKKGASLKEEVTDVKAITFEEAKPMELKKERPVLPPKTKIRLGTPERAKSLDWKPEREAAPVEKEEKKEEKALPKISIPTPKSKIRFPNIKDPKILLIIGLIIAIGVVAWFLVKPQEEVVVSTPTPISTHTPTPKLSPPKISNWLKPGYSLVLPLSGDPFAVLDDFLSTVSFSTFREAKLVKVVDENKKEYLVSQLFGRFLIDPPDKFLSSIDNKEWSLFVYGQRELFNEKGVLDLENLPEKPIIKLGFIAKVVNSEDLRSALNVWELTMPEDLKDLFGFNPKDAESETFLNNIYRGVPIRYKNFPYPDKTIDYAIVNLPKYNVSYFILLNSRESIYSIIELLLK